MYEKKKLKFSTLISTTFVCLIIQLIDMLSYGNALFFTNSNQQLSKILKPDDIAYLKNCGSLCYIYSTIISQLGFNLFSRIPAAILSGVIVESLRSMSNNYGKVILQYTNDLDGYMSNFLILLLVTTLTFSFVSLLLAVFDLGQFITFIPKSVINGCFGTIGLIQFPVGWECLVPDKFTKNSIFLVIVGLTIALILFGLEYRWPTVDFIIPLYSIIIIILSYIIFFSNFFKHPSKNRFDLIRELNILPQKENILHFTYIFKHFYIQKVEWKIILYCMPRIFSIVFFNIIYSAVNLPGYQYSTNIKLNFSKELAAQGYTNLFTCIPSYFVASYSITFYRIGGNRKLYGFVSAISLLTTAIFGLFLKGYIPTFLLSLVPFLLCLTFLHMAFFKCLKDVSYIEYFISVVICVCTYFTKEFALGLILGISLYLIIFFFEYCFIDKRSLRELNGYLKRTPMYHIRVSGNREFQSILDRSEIFEKVQVLKQENIKEQTSGMLRHGIIKDKKIMKDEKSRNDTLKKDEELNDDTMKND
ncbi:Sulfate Permease (SulP) Family, partial [Pseudoloma neurophilia]